MEFIRLKGLDRGARYTDDGTRPGARRIAPLIKREMTARITDASIKRTTYDDFSWNLEVMRTVWRFNGVTPPKGCASWSGFKKRWLVDTELKSQVKEARRLFKASRQSQPA